MIHKIVDEAYKDIQKYEVPLKDVLEMMYCYGRIDASQGHQMAYETLHDHLANHYTPKGEPKTIIYMVEVTEQ